MNVRAAERHIRLRIRRRSERRKAFAADFVFGKVPYPLDFSNLSALSRLQSLARRVFRCRSPAPTPPGLPSKIPWESREAP